MIRLDSGRARRNRIRRAGDSTVTTQLTLTLNIQVMMDCQWNTYLRFFALIFLGDLHDRQFMLVSFSGSAFLPGPSQSSRPAIRVCIELDRPVAPIKFLLLEYERI